MLISMSHRLSIQDISYLSKEVENALDIKGHYTKLLSQEAPCWKKDFLSKPPHKSQSPF